MYHNLEALIDSLKEITGLEICVLTFPFLIKSSPNCGWAPPTAVIVPVSFLDEIRSHTHSKLLQSFLDMLKLCYWESRNLGSFARGVGASESKITRLFKQETGKSFRQIVKKPE